MYISQMQRWIKCFGNKWLHAAVTVQAVTNTLPLYKKCVTLTASLRVDHLENKVPFGCYGILQVNIYCSLLLS
jgi:hypothetical protein